jgi:dipeptidyl-peptidase-3
MRLKKLSALLLAGTLLGGCGGNDEPQAPEAKPADPAAEAATPAVSENKAENGFEWKVDRFADIGVLRYQIKSWDELSLQQKKYAYFLVQAGLAGRDIMWHQNNRYNLPIRRTLETIYSDFKGNRKTEQWLQFETYLKRIWFANGIHHHYGNQKMLPEFKRDYLQSVADATATPISEELMNVIFDPELEAKKVSLDADAGLLESSAVNFYAPDVTTAEAQAYYEKVIDKKDEKPISYGLNSRLEKDADGTVVENVWKVGGLYGEALLEVNKWLGKAAAVAENEAQAEALRTLIKYYQTGDLKLWDEYNIQWAKATDGDIDYINGFVEVYNDPLGYRGSYEMIVQIKDFDASRKMQMVRDNAQWFEDNSPIASEHKREKVVGISYNVVDVAGEAGDASPSTPIGVNLPNANWIRATVGSKSVSLGNIQAAYREASGPAFTEEFAHDAREIELAEKHGATSSKLSTALHEVIGHASGKLEAGVGTPKETLKNYSSTIEEGRADLIALYFSNDPKLVELGVIESADVGIAHYDRYIRNGMMVQLRRVELGDDIEESHMRNRAWISRWVFEKGQKDKVIEIVNRDGKTFYDIKDYAKLRSLFGELLKEVQRIKSQGDFEAAKALVEGYGVKIDETLHKEVLARSEALDVPPYNGFVNPLLTPQLDAAGEISDIVVEQPGDFVEQMLDYSERFSHLPAANY